MTIVELGRTAVRGRPLRVPLVIVVAPLLLAAIALTGFHVLFADRILPGVRVGSVDVGGLSRDAARARLTEAYSYLGSDTTLLTGRITPVQLSVAPVDRRLDVEAAIGAAFAAGRGSNPVETAAATIQLAIDGGRSVAPSVSVNDEALRLLVDRLAASLDVPPVDARVTVDSDGFRVIAASPGQELDRTALIDALRPLLVSSGPLPESIEVAFDTVRPGISTATAEGAVAAAERFAGSSLTVTIGSSRWAADPSLLRTWIGFRSGAGTIRPILHRDMAAAWFGQIAAEVDREAVDASFAFRGGRVVAVPAKAGRRVDVSASIAALDEAVAAAVRGDARPDQLPLVVASPAPDLTTEEAETLAARMKRVSKWTTYFVPSERNGYGANIRVPARAINGTVVMPGEVFDYWEAVGEVSRRTGFRQGAAIINGRTEPQGAFAGGICTSSTTMFNAAARAGYEVLDRRAHFYYIDRYPLGLDATVFKTDGYTQTMAFRNDTKYPLLVRGLAGATWTSFEIWSVPTGRSVSFSSPVMKNHREASSSIEYDPSKPVDFRKVVEVPTDGMDVSVTRIVRDRSGKIIHRDTWFSRYRTINGLTIRGGKPS